MSISHVWDTGSQFKVYNSRCEEISSQYKNSSDKLVGVSGDFYVVETDSKFISYDDTCRQIESMYKNDMDIIGCAGESIVAKDRQKIYCYDKRFQQTGSRYI